jgi:predicted  nucleic acid-binding Zn-ribbon protein
LIEGFMIAAEVFLSLLVMAAQGDQSPKGGEAPSAGPEVQELGGEIKITVEEIKKHEVTLAKVAEELTGAVTGGKDLRETVVALEKKYATAVKEAKDDAAKKELSFALEMLHRERARVEFDRASKLNPKLPPWVLPFAKQAMSGSGEEGTVDARSGAFDGGGRHSGEMPAVQPDTIFQGSPRGPVFTGPATSFSSRLRISRDVMNRLEDLKPHVQKSTGALSTVSEVEAAAKRNSAERKGLEAEIAKGKEEIASLSRSVAALESKLGPLPAASAPLTQEMAAINRANAELLPKSQELSARKKALVDAIENRKATLQQWQSQIDADPTGFYNRNKSDCDVTRTEKQADGSSRFWYTYRPGARLSQEIQRDVDAWKQLDAQQAPMGKELDSHVERWNKLKEKRDAVAQKEKLARLEQLQKSRIERLDLLRNENAELKSRLQRMLAELKDFARRMGQWVREAQDAVVSVREGR